MAANNNDGGETMGKKLQQRIADGKREHGDRFSDAGLMAAHESIRRAYEHGQRVKIRTDYGNGEVFERAGVVSTTTGWVPVFILMHRSNDIGSWDTLGERDRVIAVKYGRTYVAIGS